jgi:WD40 repeat protein/transcriptional regulator with XRE-family HTH domain
MDPAQSADSFRNLLLRYGGRAGLIQRELAARAGVSRRSVQGWEAGDRLPNAEGLAGLIKALLEAGGLTHGQETAEARGLWAAAEREAPRALPPFDAEWFAGLLAPRAPPPVEAALAERAHDWGDAPDTAHFVGRGAELDLLRDWLLNERCRILAVLGMGGIGKTSVAARLAQSVAPSFPNVYWRSLRNAPPVADWLAGVIGFLSDQQLVPPTSESEQLIALLQLLRASRCLLVLDNSETLFEPGYGEGRYRAGMEGYGRLLQMVGESSHQSCLLLTSREAPPELAVFGGGVRSLQLHGLGAAEAQSLLAEKQLSGDAGSWVSLVDRYGGNGLALKIVGETIRQVFSGDIGAYLRDAIATYGAVFGGIRRLLDAQIERLSAVERDVLERLAIERESIRLAELAAQMAPNVGRNAVIQAIETLRRRSLVERADGGATFALQSMVLEYITDRLVEGVADEIGRGEPVTVVELPVIKAQAKDYVRQAQERLIGTPIVQRLNARFSDAGAQQRLLDLLNGWRGRPAAAQGYGPGNVVNLLRLLRGDLRGLDLSELSLRQVYLQGVEAQGASLAGSHLSEVILAEAFAYPASVALSGDGAFLAAGMPAGEVRVWRVADRTLLLSVQGHSGLVHGVALSRDGRLLASGSFDGTIRLWETTSGQPLASLEGHTGAVWGVGLSGDGRLLASGGFDATVRLWETGSAALLATLHGHAEPVNCVALSADGRLVASGGRKGALRLWESGSGQCLASLDGHSGEIRGVAFTGDGRLLASGGDDGTLRLWNTASGEALEVLQAHSRGVSAVAVSEDGRLLASSDPDGTVRLWELDSGELLATLQGHTGNVWGLALTADAQLLASGGGEGTIRLWETATQQPLATLRGHTGAVWSLALTDDGRLVATGGADGMVRLWDADGRALSALRGHGGIVCGVALAADGRRMASGGSFGAIRLWDPEHDEPVATLPGHSGVVLSIAISQDGRRVVSAGADGTVRLWDAERAEQLAALRGHSDSVWGVALAEDERLVASAGADGTVRLWDLESAQPLAALRGHAGLVRCVAISGDGHVVASGGADGTVRLWQAPSGDLLQTLRGHTGMIRGVALSGDGRLAASGGGEGTVKLWETSSGQLLATLEGHTGAVWAAALTRDGSVVASGAVDCTVRLWDAASGACLQTLRADRSYERLNITGLTGITAAQHAALLALGATVAPGLTVSAHTNC